MTSLWSIMQKIFHISQPKRAHSDSIDQLQQFAIQLKRCKTSDSSVFSRLQQPLRPQAPFVLEEGTGAVLQLLIMFTVYDLLGVGSCDVTTVLAGTPDVAGALCPNDGGRM